MVEIRGRGFVFSMDALFAGAVIVIAAAAMFLVYPATEGGDLAYDMVSMKAHDRAVVDFYFGGGGTYPTSCGADDDFCNCVEYYNYPTPLETGTLNTETVCGVYG